MSANASTDDFKAVAEQLARALGSGDFETIFKLHAPECVVIYPKPQYLEGPEQVVEVWKLYYSKPLTHPVTVDHVEVDGALASCWGRFFHGTKGEPPEKFWGAGYYLSTWKKKSGQWQVVRFHASQSNPWPSLTL